MATQSNRLTFSTGIARNSFGPDHPEDYAAYLSGLSDNRVYGYTLGGLNTGAGFHLAVCYRLSFSSQTIAAQTTGDLAVERARATSTNDGAVYGYITAGSSDTNSYLATCERMTFSTSVMAAYTQGNISQGRRYPAGVSDFAV